MPTQRQGADDRQGGAREMRAGWEPGLEPTDGEGGAGLLGVWIVTATVAGLGLLVVAIGVVAHRLPPGALLGAWLLANGLLGLVALLSAVLPTPRPPSAQRHPGSRGYGTTAARRLQR